MQSDSMKINNKAERESVSRLSLQIHHPAKRMAARVSVSLFLLSLGLPGCATGSATQLQPVKTFKRWIEIGQASWYGLKFQGRKTATGESFDMNLLTCAHRSLPLGSWVKVTNLKNRKSVVVRVNDRGPGSDSRIVDLSYAAAQAVGLHGIGKVRLDTMRDGDPELAKALLAQVQMPMALTPLMPAILPRY